MIAPRDREAREPARIGALNAIKHMASASDTSISLDLDEAAHSMIVRACHNYALLGLPPASKMRRFEDLFYEDVIGV